MEQFEQVADLANRIVATVGGHLRTICRWLRAVARAGLVMGLLVWASLVPWLWRLSDPLRWVAVVALGLLPVWMAWSLRRHANELEEVYGDTDVLRTELSSLGDTTSLVQQRVGALQEAPTGRFARIRWAFGYLNGLRSTWSDLGLTDRLQRLAEPVNPARLAASTWKTIALAVTVVAGPAVIVLSLVAWALVG